MKSPLLGRLASLTLLSATLVSCSPDSPTAVATPGDDAAQATSPFNRTVVRLAAATGDNQVGIAGKRLGSPVTVRVVDASGRPVANAAVAFAASQGVASSRVVYTDAQGNASVNWTLGPALGSQTLRASNKAGGGVTIAATALSSTAVVLEKMGGEGQSATPGATLAAPLAVKVMRGGVPAANATVTWTVATGGGSLSTQTSTTGADGYARVNWTVGSAAGTQMVRATVEGATEVTFVTVVSRPIARIILTPTSMSLYVGYPKPGQPTQGQIVAVAVDSLGVPVPTKFTYTESLPDYVDVDSTGLVTATSAGAFPGGAAVTVSAGGKYAVERITVTYVYSDVAKVDRILISAVPGPQFDTREREQYANITVNFKVPVDAMNLRIRSPSGATTYNCSANDPYNEYKLRWNCGIYLPKGSEGGLWTVDRIAVPYQGKTFVFTNADLVADGVPIYPLNVIAYPVDHDAPVVDTAYVRFTLSGTNGTFEVGAAVRDPGAGLKAVSALLRGPNGRILYMPMGGNSAISKFFSSNVLVGRPEQGTWSMDQLIASDLLGNTITLTTAQLRARGYAIDVVVPEIPEF